ncbi:MAG TPA: helix-turn-helix domain-containing protein [Candidatus Limnocylindria bacterium]|nr:helix-turn-helix domain-containing protein [Candidatus Limnocylindria bacterium]
MPSLGEQLRAQREHKAITLEQAAADTRIREKFLKALEEGDYPSLPGAVYTRGFLRNYSDYLDLETDELVVLYQQERGGAPPEPAPKRSSYKPYRPVVHQSFIFRPVIFVPVLIIAFVGSFLGYIYYQFTTFATLPKLEIVEPPSDGHTASADLIVRGVTVPGRRVTVKVAPGSDFVEIYSGDDGAFGTKVVLSPGANHVLVEVQDAAGKQNQVSRTIQYQAPTTAIGPAPQLVVEQPAAGASLTNVSVLVSGHVDRSVSRLLINNLAVPVSTDGTFQSRYFLPAGPQSFRVTAQTASGGTVEETRNVVVVYTAAVVNVFVRGGDTWMLATVDGADVPGSGRLYKDGETAAFIGKEVRIKAGNAAAAQVIYNGQMIAGLGKQGEVVERVFVAQ